MGNACVTYIRLDNAHAYANTYNHAQMRVHLLDLLRLTHKHTQSINNPQVLSSDKICVISPNLEYPITGTISNSLDSKGRVIERDNN